MNGIYGDFYTLQVKDNTQTTCCCCCICCGCMLTGACICSNMGDGCVTMMGPVEFQSSPVSDYVCECEWVSGWVRACVSYGRYAT